MSVTSQQVNKSTTAQPVHAAQGMTAQVRGFAGNHTLMRKQGPSEDSEQQVPETVRPLSEITGQFLQRKCACNGSGNGGDCEECKTGVQRKSASGVQAKLSVSSPGDVYEKEADQLAEQVMRMPDQQLSGFRESHKGQTDHPGREQKRFQTKHIGSSDLGWTAAPPVVHEVLRSPGQPLDRTTRAFMEPRFGRDFGNLRVHMGAKAAESAQAVNALAYTVGSDMVFSDGRYQPSSHEGRRLIAHELAHTVQQGAVPGKATAPGPAGVVQREVNPNRIEPAGKVLGKIEGLANTFIDEGKIFGPALANMVRLGTLGLGFNPGSDTSEAKNSFIYTCRCGWLDMGHFFISAAASYGVAYLRQFESLKLGGLTKLPDKALTAGLKYARPVLVELLKTVASGDQGEKILGDVDKLMESGEPKDLGLVFGYWMEFVQQVAKLAADPMKSPPEFLKGSQRSAFTMEDLPSDWYGASFGQDVWERVGMSRLDSSPIHKMMEKFFSDCGAVFPDEKTRCKMMAETTPGSCTMAGNRPVWAKDGGSPARYTTTIPNLLETANEICPGATALIYESGGGDSGKGREAESGKTSKEEMDRFLFFRGFRLSLGSGLHVDNFFMDPLDTLPTFAMDFSLKRRRASLTVIDDIPLGKGYELRGPITGGVGLDGKFFGVGNVYVPSIESEVTVGLGGDLDLSDILKLKLPKLKTKLTLGPLEIDASITIRYDRLQDLKKGPLAPEVKKFEEILDSGDLEPLIEAVITRKMDWKPFKDRVIGLVRAKYPEGKEAAIRHVLEAFVADVISHATVDAQGTGTLLGVPVLGVRVQKKAPIRLRGFDVPVFQYDQWGLLFPQFLKGEALRQFPLGVGYTMNWLAGDPRPGGPGIGLGFTAGVGLPQSEVFVEAHAGVKTLEGLQLNLSLYYAPARFGPRETPMGDPMRKALFGEGLQGGEKEERHLGPVNAVLSVEKGTVSVDLRYEHGPEDEGGRKGGFVVKKRF